MSGHLGSSVDDAIRDLSELDPADPSSTNTICVRHDDLLRILNRHFPSCAAVAELIEAAKETREIFKRINDDDENAINDSCEGILLIDAALARCGGAE